MSEVDQPRSNNRCQRSIHPYDLIWFYILALGIISHLSSPLHPSETSPLPPISSNPRGSRTDSW